MNTRAFSKFLIFLNAIVENIPWTLKLLFCVHFMLKKPCNINFWIENDLPSLWNFSENSSNLVPPSIPRLMCFAGNMGHHLETSEEGLCQERCPQGLQHHLQRLKESPAHFLAAQQNINCAASK